MINQIKFVSLCLALSLSVVTAQETQPPDPDAAGAETEAMPEPIPRVVGQAQTQDELDAWNQVDSAAGQEQILLAKQFLQQYPDSGLSAWAHSRLAKAYYGLSDVDSFLTHGEESIKELPDDPVIMVQLAFMWAERGMNGRPRPAQAIQRGEKGLETLNTMDRPDHVGLVEWTQQSRALKSEAHYAIGFSKYRQATAARSPEQKKTLNEEALVHLKNAVENDPEYDRAYLRLGDVYTQLNDAENAVNSYGSVVAIARGLETFAMQNINRIFDVTKREPKEVQKVLKERKDLLQEQRKQREAEVEELKKQEEIEKREEMQRKAQEAISPTP